MMDGLLQLTSILLPWEAINENNVSFAKNSG